MFLKIEQINTALKLLKVETKPLWGKMSAQHMVEHIILALGISNGNRYVKVYTEDKIIPIQKRFLLSNKPLPKLFINPAIGEELLPLEFSDLDSAKNALINEIHRYEEFFNCSPESTPAHPVFGKLNKNEWDIFHKKHFEHHFAQFGISI